MSSRRVSRRFLGTRRWLATICRRWGDRLDPTHQNWEGMQAYLLRSRASHLRACDKLRVAEEKQYAAEQALRECRRQRRRGTSSTGDAS